MCFLCRAKLFWVSWFCMLAAVFKGSDASFQHLTSTSPCYSPSPSREISTLRNALHVLVDVSIQFSTVQCKCTQDVSHLLRELFKGCLNSIEIPFHSIFFFLIIWFSGRIKTFSMLDNGIWIVLTQLKQHFIDINCEAQLKHIIVAYFWKWKSSVLEKSSYQPLISSEANSDLTKERRQEDAIQNVFTNTATPS